VKAQKVENRKNFFQLMKKNIRETEKEKEIEKKKKSS